jgi:hypothetical protein
MYMYIDSGHIRFSYAAFLSAFLRIIGDFILRLLSILTRMNVMATVHVRLSRNFHVHDMYILATFAFHMQHFCQFFLRVIGV